jgi:hypothetical protein
MTAAVFAALFTAAQFADPPSSDAAGPTCLGDTSAAAVTPVKGAPPLRFGINPAGFAGALGPPVAETPEDPAKTLAALARLRPRHASFTLRLNRLFWSDHAAGIARFARLARHYARHGYRVEVQVRYHPDAKQEGRIAAWVDYVRRVTRRLGAIRGVTGLQITNEVNFLPIAPDASDSAFAGARDALIRGVETAHRVVRRRGLQRVSVGFNWAYRNTPANETDFWTYLHDNGGRRFARAVDWVGLDAYPGTIFPPTEPGPSGYADGMVNAMSVLRDCYMPVAGLGRHVPIHVEENGWPTGPGRSEATQVTALRQMVKAVNRFRATYGVTAYRWFDLRDHNTSSDNFQHHYGLLRDDYSKKPAFGIYRKLVGKLAHST